MPLPLQFRSALLLAASALATPALAQAPPMVSGDPFAGGAYAIPAGAPIELGMGDPLATAAMTPQPMMPGSMVAGNSVFMAPEIVGGGGAVMNYPPGGADCPSCNSGGAPLPYGANMMAPGFGSPPMASPMGQPMGPMMGAPMGPTLGVPLGGMEGPETIYPGYVDPTADIPAGAGYEGFGGVGVPPVLAGPPAPGMYPSGQRCGWAAGFTFVFLKPHYGSNDAFFVGTPTGSGFNVANREFSYNLDLSPRVFLEWVAPNDFGFRVTWFSFENGADAVTDQVGDAGFIRRPLSPTEYPGGRITAGNDVSLNVLDFDLTQRLRVRRSLLNLGVGLRLANYEQDYTSTISNPAYGAAVGNAGQQFNGFGPSVFAEWRRPIGQTRFSLLANIRGSMLYGESKTDIFQRDPMGQTFSFQADNDDFVAVGEAQLGGEWSAWISNRTVLFVQAAFESQYWMGVGTAFDRNDDLGLIGVNTTVGLEW